MNDQGRRAAKTRMYRTARDEVDAVGASVACRVAIDESNAAELPNGESLLDKDDQLTERISLLQAVGRGMTIGEYLRADSAVLWMDMDDRLAAMPVKGGAA